MSLNWEKGGREMESCDLAKTKVPDLLRDGANRIPINQLRVVEKIMLMRLKNIKVVTQ